MNQPPSRCNRLLWHLVVVVSLVLFLGDRSRPVDALAINPAIPQRPTSQGGEASSSSRERRLVIAPIVPPPVPQASLLEEEPVPELTRDVVALADLRFDEWIAPNTDPTMPPKSRHAYRLATSAVASERKAMGPSYVFLARLEEDASSAAKATAPAVAAAELNQIEIAGASVVVPPEGDDASEAPLTVAAAVAAAAAELNEIEIAGADSVVVPLPEDEDAVAAAAKLNQIEIAGAASVVVPPEGDDGASEAPTNIDTVLASLEEDAASSASEAEAAVISNALNQMESIMDSVVPQQGEGASEAPTKIELDPIETLLEDGASEAYYPATLDTTRNRWYVTDVVTESRHRRRGIAGHLMDAMELQAWNEHAQKFDGSTPLTLYLHVNPDNHAARAFYAHRGYAAPTADELEGLDVAKLEDSLWEGNGTEGDLLCKTLADEPTAADEIIIVMDEEPVKGATTAETTKAASAGGFGGMGGGSSKTKKKKGKRKKR